MGYLDNSTLIVDAVLTKKGREKLAQDGTLDITQFALGDDEIDYDLWNPSHPLGSDFYGVIIENLPITEAIADETEALKYKLVTLPSNTTTLPFFKFEGSNTETSLNSLQDTDSNKQYLFQFITENVSGDDEGVAGYKITLTDDRAGTISTAEGNRIGDVQSSISVTGRNSQVIRITSGTTGFTFTAADDVASTDSPLKANIIIEGLKTGVRQVIPIKITDNNS